MAPGLISEHQENPETSPWKRVMGMRERGGQVKFHLGVLESRQSWGQGIRLLIRRLPWVSASPSTKLRGLDGA